MIRVLILGAKKLADDFIGAERRLPDEVEQRTRQAGELVVREWQRGFKGSRTRARYEIRGGRKVLRKHPRPVTSPPRVLGVFTGQYRKAISAETKRSGRRTHVEVGPVGIPYAAVHEFGSARMPERPMAQPAVDRSRERVVRLIGTAFRVVR